MSVSFNINDLFSFCGSVEVDCFHFLFLSKIVELEEELRVVGNNLKSLEVSEEKVYFCDLILRLSRLEKMS